MWRLLIRNNKYGEKGLGFEQFKQALEAPSKPPPKQFKNLPNETRGLISRMRDVLTGHYTMDLEKTFGNIDTDKSKRLNEIEFEKLIRIIKPDIDTAFVREIHTIFDDDKSGDIHFDEFKAILVGQF